MYTRGEVFRKNAEKMNRVMAMLTIVHMLVAIGCAGLDYVLVVFYNHAPICNYVMYSLPFTLLLALAVSLQCQKKLCRTF